MRAYFIRESIITPAALQRGGDTRMAGTKANTPEETEVALEELSSDCIRIYTDGGSPDEHGNTAG